MHRFFVFVTTLTLSVSTPIFNPYQPKVCTPHAGCMMGTIMSGYQINAFEAFMGIPYALPPVGELRFSNPKAYPKWSGILNATMPKEDCIQKNYLIPNPQVTGQEDCLYLNVYRPILRDTSKLPVMVYIYGGGWFSGSSHPAITGPEYFMDTEKVILVTFAYRLGAMGFLSTNDNHIPGNFGLKDQVLVLKWIHKNIAAFGGNPRMVTLFGQSVGGVAAHMHMLSKQSQGLFNGIIAMSGTANVPFVITENPLEQARETAYYCNITDAYQLSPAKLVKALRSITAKNLVNAGDGLKYWNVDHVTNYRPVIERKTSDAFITQHPKVLLAKGEYKSVPILFGTVPNEGAVRVVAIMESNNLRNSFNENFMELMEKFLEFPTYFNQSQIQSKMRIILNQYFKDKPVLNDETNQGFLDMVTDRGFHHPLYNAVKMHVNIFNTTQHPIYLYNFNYKGPYTFSYLYKGGIPSRDYGVVHCDDLLYLFRSSAVFPDYAKDSVHANVVKSLVSNFVHFAKFRKPLNNYVHEFCSRASFNRIPESMCDYQHYINTVDDSFAVNTENRFNVQRMHLWDQLLQKI